MSDSGEGNFIEMLTAPIKSTHIDENRVKSAIIG